MFKIGDSVVVETDDHIGFKRGDVAQIAHITDTSVCLVDDKDRSMWLSFVKIEDVKPYDGNPAIDGVEERGFAE